MELAILFQMTFIGMPCVFYGDEKGMTGIREKEYRMPMAWDAESSLTDTYQTFIRLRREHAALREGAFITLETKGQMLRYARVLPEERIEIAVNPGPVPVPYAVSSEILLKKGFPCDLLLPSGYVIARSVNHGKHDL